MSTRRVAIALRWGLALSAAVWLSGCAQGQSGTPTSGGNVSSSSSAGSTASSTPSAGSTPTSSSAVTTVRGQVDEGVEAGCTILRADGGQVYLLIAADKSKLVAGTRVEVTGSVSPGLITTCQQGTPFMVTSAKTI